MRILFAGTAEIAIPSLKMIADTYELVAILTSPDAPQGRGLVLTPSPVALTAASYCPHVPVLKPQRLNQEVREQIRAYKPDVLVVYAYGKIFGPKFLSLFSGSINVHPSLLPRWRGPAPIPFSILNRDAQTGISIQRIAQQVDSGDIFAQVVWNMQFNETTAELTERAAVEGSQLLSDVLAKLSSGNAHAQPQDERNATYSRLITKQDGIVDWNQPAETIHAIIRAYNPWPLARTTIDGKVLYIHNAVLDEAHHGASPGTIVSIDKNRGIMVQTGTGVLCLTSVQWSGKSLLPIKDFINGARFTSGSYFV